MQLFKKLHTFKIFYKILIKLNHKNTSQPAILSYMETDVTFLTCLSKF